MSTTHPWFQGLKVVCVIALSFLVGGCHALAGALGGAGVGGGVTRSWQGAAIGGGAGMIAGQVAEDVFHLHEKRGEELSSSNRPRTLRGDCERFRRDYERMACEAGQAEAERQNQRERQWRARNYGYNTQRDRYGR